MRPLPLATALVAALASSIAFAQYSPAAGQNAPLEEVKVRYKDEQGREQVRTENRKAISDGFGNARGNQFDLAVDGAFDGQTVAVMQFYDFPFDDTRAALKEKGFSVYRWSGAAPSPKELKEKLGKACQLWIISDATPRLTPEHIKVIKDYFDAGHGVYIWGDNAPYYADANLVGQALLGTTMEGDLQGNEVVPLLKEKNGKKVGVLRQHLLTTGLEFLYEGITIATIQPGNELTPLLYGSAGNLVAAFHDRGGKRAIFDGGFTRLYNKWDTAGTARYVKNAAAWLVNVERFGQVKKTETTTAGGSR
jgi:hypothetical protein